VLNIHRQTIRKYRQWAQQYHLLEMEKLPVPFKNSSILFYSTENDHQMSFG
jgi:hypothetical protein